jgi:membrane-associated HD superfamily phosphohydrolase
MRTDLKTLSFFNSIDIHKHLHWMLMMLVLVIFLAILYPSLGTKKYIYQIGDIAKRNIKAHEDFFVEDTVATENKRLNAIENVLTVYDYQPNLSPQIIQRVKKAFENLRNVYMHTFPKHLESLPSIESSKKTALDGSNKKTIISHSLNTFIWNKKKTFENQLGITISNGAYKILMEMKFSEELSSLLAKIINDIMEKGVVVNKEILLNEIDKGISLRDVDTQTEKAVQNLKQFYGPDQAKTAVRAIAQPLFKELDYTVINLVVDFVQRLIQPNISLNRNETEFRKKQTIAQIEPVMYRVKAGEMLVREGERVTDIQLRKLIAMEDQIRRSADFTTVSGAAILLFFLYLQSIIWLLPIRDNLEQI